MQPQETQSMSNANNAKNIVLVHGGWADGSGWSKQIPILEKAGQSYYCTTSYPIIFRRCRNRKTRN